MLWMMIRKKFVMQNNFYIVNKKYCDCWPKYLFELEFFYEVHNEWKQCKHYCSNNKTDWDKL